MRFVKIIILKNILQLMASSFKLYTSMCAAVCVCICLIDILCSKYTIYWKSFDWIGYLFLNMFFQHKNHLKPFSNEERKQISIEWGWESGIRSALDTFQTMRIIDDRSRDGICILSSHSFWNGRLRGLVGCCCCCFHRKCRFLGCRYRRHPCCCCC